MNLAVFDIDGTVTDTNAVDDECFVAAVHDVLRREVSTDWSTYANVTDSGILLATGASAREIARIREIFFDALRGRAFQEIPGAGRLIARLLADPEWRVAYATGGWETSARMKLAGAGLPLDLPLASADDAITRREIVEHAISRAHTQYACDFARIVAIGDGEWDRKTAEELGLPFVGSIDWSDTERAMRIFRSLSS